MPLFHQDDVFYDLLEKQADAAHRAAQSLASLAADFGKSDTIAQAMKRIEDEADDLTHQLVNAADARFVTPLDKEDLHRLSNALDTVTDTVEAAGARVALYQLKTPRPDLAPMADLLVAVTGVTRDAVGGLRRLKDHKALEDTLVRIHDLENNSDQLYRTALGTLFNEAGAEPLLVMKWKEIYDRIEVAVDECEDVADILESLVVKYA